MDDYIRRQAAIDALDKLCDRECEYSKKQRSVMCGACHLGSAFDVVEQVPSEQPEKRTEERTETHACDLIIRQAAIDAIFSEPLYESGMKKRDADEVVPAIYEKIKSLPSAQPEIIRCKDCKWSQTINFFGTKATSCKWWEKLTDVDAFCSNGVRRNEDE